MEQEYEVQLTYFKRNGKFYTGGEYKTKCEHMFQIIDEVRKKARQNELPGINGHDWIIHINSKDHPMAYPYLIL